MPSAVDMVSAVNEGSSTTNAPWTPLSMEGNIIYRSYKNITITEF